VIDVSQGIDYGRLNENAVGLFISVSDSVERRGDTVLIRGRK
jgi:hypothetical protein